jgi:hypothetical protein
VLLVVLLQQKLVEQWKVLLAVNQDLRDLVAAVVTPSLLVVVVMVVQVVRATLDFITVTHVASFKFIIIEIRVFKDSYFLYSKYNNIVLTS